MTLFLQKVNIILTSDHGMALTPAEKVIELNTYVDPSSYDAWGGSPVLNILPKPGTHCMMPGVDLLSLIFYLSQVHIV